MTAARAYALDCPNFTPLTPHARTPARPHGRVESGVGAEVSNEIMPSRSVSVAMATCQGAPYIDEQLDSIAAQSRPPDELVVCDDASGDDTAESVEAFARRAPFPVRLRRNPSRLGTTRNFEQAVSLCSGDIIFLADQDDVWLPEKIACLLDVLERHPEAGIVFSDGAVVDDERRPLGYGLWRALAFTPAEQSRVRKGRASQVFARHVVAAGTTLAFRAGFRDLLLPFPNLHSAHDAWIAFVISCVADCRIVDRELLHYRLHGENQIGLEKLDLLEQYHRARRQVAEAAFAYAAQFFETARERLSSREGEGFRTSPGTLRLIEAKIAHSRIRDEMPASLAGRLPAILGELLRGRYWRYSYGARSIAQDIWLR